MSFDSKLFYEVYFSTPPRAWSRLLPSSPRFPYSLRRSDCGAARPTPRACPAQTCIVLRGGVSPPILNKARTRTHVRACAHTPTRTPSRASARGHTRAPCRVQFETRTGFVSNLYGFHLKPVRVSNRPHTAPQKFGIRNVEFGMALARQVIPRQEGDHTRYFGITVLRPLKISIFRNYVISIFSRSVRQHAL